MSYTAIDGLSEEQSATKKKGFFKASGIKAGHYIKVFLDIQEGDDDDGQYKRVVKVDKVKKVGSYIQIYFEGREGRDYDCLELDANSYYRRWTKNPEVKIVESIRPDFKVPQNVKYDLDLDCFFGTIKINGIFYWIKIFKDDWKPGQEVPQKYINKALKD